MVIVMFRNEGDLCGGDCDAASCHIQFCIERKSKEMKKPFVQLQYIAIVRRLINFKVLAF